MSERMCQLPALRRAEFFERLGQDGFDRSQIHKICKALNETIEASALRLGSMCDVPGCERLLASSSEPFGHNNVRHVERCPDHGVRGGIHPIIGGGSYRLIVAFYPTGATVPESYSQEGAISIGRSYK